MKSENTSMRLKRIMRDRNLKQVDILEMAKPYCDNFNVKLNKNDLSQYVSGKVEPGQIKLSILSMALNVSEAWLMGYDVPMQNAIIIDEGFLNTISNSEVELIKKYRSLSENAKSTISTLINIEYEKSGRPAVTEEEIKKAIEIAKMNNKSNNDSEHPKMRFTY